MRMHYDKNLLALPGLFDLIEKNHGALPGSQQLKGEISAQKIVPPRWEEIILTRNKLF